MGMAVQVMCMNALFYVYVNPACYNSDALRQGDKKRHPNVTHLVTLLQ